MLGLVFFIIAYNLFGKQFFHKALGKSPVNWLLITMFITLMTTFMTMGVRKFA